jgi:uncharacterized protein GlcG (DUF336 family)
MPRTTTLLPLLLLAGCAGGGSAGNPANVAASGQALAAADVDAALVRAVSQADAAGLPVAVAVCDREGEVLGVFVMAGRDVTGDGTIDAPGEDNVRRAISKAATAAAFQSEQNAFTTRTAFFIVQGHFPPGVALSEAGPLFGVQDSGIITSDVRAVAYDQAGNQVGAGISGELGGVPLYLNGAPVGGVGVDSVDVVRMRGGAPTLVSAVQDARDEAIALAGAGPLAAPEVILSTNATVGGIALPFTDAPALPPAPPLAASAAAIPAAIGALHPQFPVRASPLPPEVRDPSGQFGIRAARRYAGRVVARFGGPFASVDRDPGVTFDASSGAFQNVPVVAAEIRTFSGVPGEVNIPLIDGVEPPPAEGGLAKADLERILEQAVATADATSAGIRLPRGSGVRVHIVVVDARGNLLGGFRMGDGTLFSFDVAAQKARTAAFFSTDQFAASARGIGFLAQPFFPPGLDGTEPGPLARLRDLVNRGLVTIEDPPSFTTINPPPDAPSDGRADRNPLVPGVQSIDDYAGLVAPAMAVVDDFRARLAATAGFTPLADEPAAATPFVSPGLQSGMQTFPGGVPLYKSGRLVGAIGVSGDGVDEDDLVAFAGAVGFEPPPGARIDEAPESAIAAAIEAKLALLAGAAAAHPDSEVSAVYGPLFERARADASDRFARGLDGVRIPFVKLPRNPSAGRGP